MFKKVGETTKSVFPSYASTSAPSVYCSERNSTDPLDKLQYVDCIRIVFRLLVFDEINLVPYIDI